MISTRLEVVDCRSTGCPRRDSAAKTSSSGIGSITCSPTPDLPPERYPGRRHRRPSDHGRSGRRRERPRTTADGFARTGPMSAPTNFDKDVYYWADVEGPKDMAYLNQHVFNGKYSYFGKLMTKKLTKIINVPSSRTRGTPSPWPPRTSATAPSATRTGFTAAFPRCMRRGARPFPAVRDKLVLNVTDGIGPSTKAAPAPRRNSFILRTRCFSRRTLSPWTWSATIASSKSGRAMNVVKVNEHPSFTEYLRYAQRLGLGIGDPGKIERRSSLISAFIKGPRC